MKKARKENVTASLLGLVMLTAGFGVTAGLLLGYHVQFAEPPNFLFYRYALAALLGILAACSFALIVTSVWSRDGRNRMYFVDEKKDMLGRFMVRDDNRSVVCRVRLEEDADEIVAALNFVEKVAAAVPGLADGNASVNGADLVDIWNDHFEFNVAVARQKGRYRQKE